MKKALSMLIVLTLLCGMLVIPASAAGSGSLGMGSASGNRGDTVTLSVNLNSNPGLVTMTIRVSYDTSVLQLTNVSNSGLLVGAQLNTSYGSPYTISWVDGAATANNTKTGTIATFTFKILDDAKVGDSTVNLQFIDSYDTDYNENSFSAGSGKVTVTCNHSFGNWAKVDDANHGKTCTKCQTVQKEAHKWDSGKVTTQPTCKEEGVKTYSCTVCKATKTESVPVDSSKHVFGNLVSVNDTQHKDVCSVCKKEITENHTWDNGKVTTEATCMAEGTKTYTCTGCGFSKDSKIEKLDHKYGSWTKVDDNSHKATCTTSGCNDTKTEGHTWNSGTVTKKATCKEEGTKTYTCTGCGHTKTEKIEKLTTHTYGKWEKVDADTHKRTCTVCAEASETESHKYNTSWSKDKDNHWHECADCKDKKDAEAHKPGPEATEKDPQTCTVCKYIIKPALKHEHDYAQKWTTDEKGHWYVCDGCEEKGSYADHDFENACDKDCSVCGFTRETEHVFAEVWTGDAENHWHACTGCGLKQDEAAHEPGPAATEETAQTCTICGYEIAPALGGGEEPVADQTDGANAPGFPWVIVAVAGIVALGAILFFTLKKKK